jgi:hypothetical protein
MAPGIGAAFSTARIIGFSLDLFWDFCMRTHGVYLECGMNKQSPFFETHPHLFLSGRAGIALYPNWGAIYL